MYFLIDENLPESVGQVFAKQGAIVKCVVDLAELRGQPDEVIFEYSVAKGAIIITRDLGFANPERFDIRELKGIIILRFPNEISIATLCDEVERMTRDFKDADFYYLIVIEPGSIRKREL